MKPNREQINKYLFALAISFASLFLSQEALGGDFKGSLYDHRIFSFNQGMAFSGSGDAWGISNQLSHVKTFSKHFFHKEILSSWIINGASWISGGYNNQTGFDTSIELGFSPLKIKNHIISLTGGGCMVYHCFRAPGQGSIFNFNGNEIYQVLYTNKTYIEPGVVFGTSCYTMINSKIWLNISASCHVYIFNDPISIITLGIGLNPNQNTKRP